MVKLALGLLAAVVGVGAAGDAHAAGTKVFPGTIDSAPDVDLYPFCAAGGDAVVLKVDGASAGALTPFRADVALLDADGTPLSSLTHAWRAPYTGLYFGRITGDVDAVGRDYVVSIAINGGGATAEPVDLSVTQSQAPDPVSAGGLLTYMITMSNAGPGLALDANMLDQLPVATTFVSGNWSGPEENWECTLPPVGANGKVSCTNKCFESGGSVTFTITVRVDVCAGDVQLQNIVTASTGDPDSNPADNVAVASSTVVDPRICDDGSVCTAGDFCAPATALTEGFDLVAPRTLPPGWVATVVIGEGLSGWQTGTGVVDTAPHSVFAPDVSAIRDMVLDSPPIRILTPTAKVIFRNRYDLELQADGGVLELKIGFGPFLDIVEAGGRFEAGGYNTGISDDFQSPIAGRNAWSGHSSGYVLTIAVLPPTVVGQDVVLRWRLATDFALGSVGQWVDSIIVTGPDVCQPGALLSCDDGDACSVDSCDAFAGCRHASVPCDDGNACTDDACDALSQCVHANNSAGCDDHDVCTQIDTCVLGACAGSSPLACTPTDACATAACDEAVGCVEATANFDTTGFSASRVDGRDVAVIARCWNSCPGDPRYDAAANLARQEPCVDLLDFHVFMNAFGRSCSP